MPKLELTPSVSLPCLLRETMCPRIYSGTIQSGQRVRVLGEAYRLVSHRLPTVMVLGVTQLSIGRQHWQARLLAYTALVKRSPPRDDEAFALHEVTA